jgi:hypothetical protein
MGKSAGQGPDFTGAAEQQGQSGQQLTNQQTQANRADQSNPFSSLGWTQGPNGQWSQSSQFSGALGNAANNLEGQVGGPIGNGDQARSQAINADYASSMGLLQPQEQLQTQSNNANLAAQGITPQSQAGQQSQNNLMTQQNAENQQAMNSAIQGGTEAQQATFGENLQAQQAPLQELGQMQGLLGQQGYNQAGVAAPTNYLGAAEAQGNYNLQNQDMSNQGWGSLLSGLGAIAPYVAYAAAHGGEVPGRANTLGDSHINDTVPVMLSPKEIVIPRSHATPEKAKQFVKQVHSGKHPMHSPFSF